MRALFVHYYLLCLIKGQGALGGIGKVVHVTDFCALHYAISWLLCKFCYTVCPLGYSLVRYDPFRHIVKSTGELGLIIQESVVCADGLLKYTAGSHESYLLQSLLPPLRGTEQRCQAADRTVRSSISPKPLC